MSVGLASLTIDVSQHEIMEILGGGGAGSTLGSFDGVAYGATDLYRYSGLSKSYTTDTTATACLSVDGGQTCIAAFNQTGGGSDYGDFLSPVTDPSAPCLIQSAYICDNPETPSIRPARNFRCWKRLDTIQFRVQSLALAFPA